MGQYKVPQDVESEDKLLGPLSLRQFIYVLIALAWGGVIWRIFSLLKLNIVFMIIAILPVSGLFILLGIGRRNEQSFENYFVAMVRFAFVPRIRVWDKDLSTESVIKAEKEKPVVVDSKNVSKSSLEQLAIIMDTHGNQKDSRIQLHDGTNPTDAYAQRVIGPKQIAGAADRYYGTNPMSPGATNSDDVLNQSSGKSQVVGQMLQNVEANIQQQAIENVQNSLNQTTQNSSIASSAPGSPSQVQTPDAILKKAMLQSDSLNIEQIGRQVTRSANGLLDEGQPVNITAPNQQ